MKALFIFIFDPDAHAAKLAAKADTIQDAWELAKVRDLEDYLKLYPNDADELYPLDPFDVLYALEYRDTFMNVWVIPEHSNTWEIDTTIAVYDC